MPIGIDMVSARDSRAGSWPRGRPAFVSRGGGVLLDVVNGTDRTTTGFPQPDRHPDRDQRQPDADGDRAGARPAAAARGRAAADPAAEGVALQAVDRLHPLGPAGHPRRGVAEQGPVAVPDLADGDELDRAREQGQLDGAADLDRAGQGRRGQGSGRGGGGRQARVGVGSAVVGAVEVLRLDADAGAAGPARVHHPVGPAGLPHGDQVRQRAHQGRHRSAPGDRRVHRSPGRAIRRDPTC